MRRSFMRLSILAIVMMLLIPSYGYAQGRGHGRGQAKKFGKFINGHDARDGRWDGRGPKRKRFIGKRRVHHRYKHWLRRR